MEAHVERMGRSGKPVVDRSERKEMGSALEHKMESVHSCSAKPPKGSWAAKEGKKNCGGIAHELVHDHGSGEKSLRCRDCGQQTPLVNFT